MKTVALIPIRAGSKGIPGKNMKDMCGKPLCFWVIEAALNAESIDKVWVSTDYLWHDKCFPEHPWESLAGYDNDYIETLYRPDWLATDTASSDDVLRHFCWEVCEPEDHVVMLQATSPLTTSEDIDGAMGLFGECDNHYLNTVVSGVKAPQRFFWKNGNALYNPYRRPVRDDIPPMHMENGAIYLTHARRILEGEARCYAHSLIYEMPPETATEIDTPEDWDIVEKLLEARLS